LKFDAAAVRLLKVLLVGCAAAYVLIGIGLFVGQRHIIFPSPATRGPLVGGVELVKLPGGTVLLWRAARNAGPVLVHFHGNAEEVANSAWLAQAAVSRGFSFAAIEYPGYAGAPGSPSEESILKSATRGLEHLRDERHISPERIVLSGQSLGSGVAVAMAARGWGRRLALLSPYTSLPDVAAAQYPWLPVRWLMREAFDSAERAPAVKVPVLVIHGTDDEVIPATFGRSLSRRFPNAKYREVPGTGHNDIWDAPGVLDAYFEHFAAD
jgi:pimeloyl-ACP methyl ester carboxylesterase